MTEGSLFNFEYRNYCKNRKYLWYRDYRDNRHLDDSTIVRFGIAIYIVTIFSIAHP